MMNNTITFDTTKMAPEMAALLNQLAAMMTAGEEPKVKYFVPKDGQEFFFLTAEGDVGEATNETDYYEEMFAIGNCFETAEEAEFMAEKFKVTAELLRYGQDHNEPMDWDDYEEKKYKPAYNFEKEELDPTWCKRKATGGVYFSSYELCMEACKAVGEERVAKYFLGIEQLR